MVGQILGQVNCYSSSLFNDTSIFYDITAPLATYDCRGNHISYIPNIGIDSNKGKVVSFEVLSRQKFCDTTFKIIVSKDDQTVISIKPVIFIQFQN